MPFPQTAGRMSSGATKLHSSVKTGSESSKPNKQSSTENEHSEHALSRMEIEVHRGGKNNEITGHTVKHHFPTSYSKSGAFGEYKEPETYVFDGDGKSSTHGSFADHINEHLPHLFASSGSRQENKGMIEANNKPGQGDDDEKSDYEG